jgi:hypothetical protein
MPYKNSFADQQERLPISKGTNNRGIHAIASEMKKEFANFCVALIGGSALLMGLPTSRAAAQAEPTYPYRGATFTSFVTESYQSKGATSSPNGYYTWMDRALNSAPVRQKLAAISQKDPAWKQTTWADVADAERRALQAIPNTANRTARERAFCAALHTAVKAAIPRFSLDRGFEFVNTVRYGERQCFLQSVLVAGVLHSAGMKAGVAMVYRNDKGDYSNNGHAVPVAHLSDGTDIIVDCSDPTPFIRQQGLFLRDAKTNGYRYVEPVYSGKTPTIVAYKAQANGAKLSTSAVRGLDIPFLRSQFSYYRGERTPGSLLGPGKPTSAGLAAAAARLKEGIRQCPQNPLAQYMLGRVYMKTGQLAEAQRQLDVACKIYAGSGWVPPGEQEALKVVRRQRAKDSKTAAL